MHATTEQIEDKIAWVKASPAERRTVRAIVIRPAVNERIELESCSFSHKLGVEGDFWLTNCWKKLSDRTSDPTVQVAIMNSRAIEIIAGSRERRRLAGDQLTVEATVQVVALNTLFRS